MVKSNNMAWLDVKLPKCIICGSKAAAVFLEIGEDNKTICFSCCDLIRIMTEERIKETDAKNMVYNKGYETSKPNEQEYH